MESEIPNPGSTPSELPRIGQTKPDVQTDGRSDVRDDAARVLFEARQQRKMFAARAIQNHFKRHPDSVIIASIAGGSVICDVTEFESGGDMLFCAKMIEKYVTEGFENALISAMRGKGPTE